MFDERASLFLDRAVDQTWCNPGQERKLRAMNRSVRFGKAEFGKQSGVRVDRVYEFEVLEMDEDGKTIKLEIQYKYEPRQLKEADAGHANRAKSVVFRPQGQLSRIQAQNSLTHSNQYRFDILSNKAKPNLNQFGARKTWIHLQNDSDLTPFQHQNEVEVYPGDTITVSFCLLNLNGFVDQTSIKCMVP